MTCIEIRSIVGLLPLIAIDTIEPELMDQLTTFERRIQWFVHNRPHLSGNIASVEVSGEGKRRLLAIVTKERLTRILSRMLDEDEFLSDYGIRSLSKYHEQQPYTYYLNGEAHTVRYLPAESDSGLFGGNSNWRGPIWLPLNYLLIEALRKYHHYYGEEFTVEHPTDSGEYLTLEAIANELSRRLIRLFLRDKTSKRPIYGGQTLLQDDPHWRDLILFNEYFNGDNGAGLGASHQTGWTGLVANLIQQAGGIHIVPDSGSKKSGTPQDRQHRSRGGDRNKGNRDRRPRQGGGRGGRRSSSQKPHQSTGS